MRAPRDLPRRRRVRLGRGRVWLVVGIGLIIVLLTSLRGIARFYTDYLWFEELGFTSVWRGVLLTKALLVVVFVALAFVILWVNLVIGDRLAPRLRLPGTEDELVQRYREVVGPHTGKV